MVTTEPNTKAIAASAHEAQCIFEAETQRCLGMAASDFMQKFDEGHWPHPDAMPHVMYLQSVRKFAGQ
jgi:hypothetical protein